MLLIRFHPIQTIHMHQARLHWFAMAAETEILRQLFHIKWVAIY